MAWKAMMTGIIISRAYWYTANSIAEAKRRTLKEKLAIGAMKRIIKE